MRHLAPFMAALALTACAVPGQPGKVVPGADGVIVNNGGAIVGNAGGNVLSPNGGQGQPSAAPLPADEDMAYGAVTMAATDAILAGAPAEGAKAEAPFTTLAVGDRLKERLGTPEEIQAKLQGQARGTFQVDLTKIGTTTAVTKTAAEPATATLVKYLGLGTEPLHGLSTELRGVTVDRATRTMRSQIAEQQGVVMLGGKNLFGQGQYAKLPFMKGAVAEGFGAEGTAGTRISYKVAASGPASETNAVAVRYELAMTSLTVPQVTGDFTLAIVADQAAQSATVTLTGPYTVKAPGAEVVLKTGTMAKSKTTTLTEAKATFMAALESLQAMAAK